MKRLTKLSILCSIILILGNTFIYSQDIQNIEKCLPPDSALVISFNQLGDNWHKIMSWPLFTIFENIHKKEKPGKASIKFHLQKIMKHPFYGLIKDKVVLGLVPPKKKGKKPIFVLALSAHDIAKNVEKFIVEAKKNNKIYILQQEQYEQGKMLVSLHPDKGKLSKHFTVFTDKFLITSNDKKQLKTAYDKMVGRCNDYFIIPKIYKSMAQNSFFRFYVNIKKMNIDLSKNRHKVPSFLKEYVAKLKNFVRFTDEVLVSCSLQNNVICKIIRKKSQGSPSLLPSISISSNLIDNKTLAFLALPIPYDVLWYGFKHKAKKVAPRKFRKAQARLDEFFGWADFEEDVLPNIGPNTALLIKRPAILKGKPFYLPLVSLMLKLSLKIDFSNSFDKLWQFASKNPKVMRHIKRSQANINDAKLTLFNFCDTPIDNMVSPGYAIAKGWFLLGTSGAILKNLITTLDIAKKSSANHLYFYLNFCYIAEYLKANLQFLRKQALRKGRPWQIDKINHFFQLLQGLQYCEISGRTTVDYDELRCVLQLSE